MKKSTLLIGLGLVLFLAGCNISNNTAESIQKDPLQRKLIEPVKRQVVISGASYSQQDMKEAIDLVKELLK